MTTNIPIIIVAYRNAGDVTECLGALRLAAEMPGFDIYICENGGAAAFDSMVAALVATDGPCEDIDSAPIFTDANRFVRLRSLRLRGRSAHVVIGEATENLGYAGGINAWIEPLMQDIDWPGLWILNPDTQPDAHALAELAAWTTERKKGMVGSRIVLFERPDTIITRGLRCRPFQASTGAIDFHASAAIEPNHDELEVRMDAPSGASLYVTRECVERIGPMDDRYFLYYEDLDWGYRAKKAGGIGYAYRSIVRHRGGTTIGSGIKRTTRSPLAVYLEFRNRILFIRRHHLAWLPWTVLVLLVRAATFGAVGASHNMWVAFHGLIMGLVGETGRPDNVLRSHRR